MYRWALRRRWSRARERLLKCSSSLAGARSWCAQAEKQVNSLPMSSACRARWLMEPSDAGHWRSRVEGCGRGVRAKRRLALRGARARSEGAGTMAGTGADRRAQEAWRAARQGDGGGAAWDGAGTAERPSWRRESWKRHSVAHKRCGDCRGREAGDPCCPSHSTRRAGP